MTQGGSEEEGGEHILSITSLDETDYGNYTCEAINSIGKSTQTLELKGKALSMISKLYQVSLLFGFQIRIMCSKYILLCLPEKPV